MANKHSPCHPYKIHLDKLDKYQKLEARVHPNAPSHPELAQGSDWAEGTHQLQDRRLGVNSMRDDTWHTQQRVRMNQIGENLGRAIHQKESDDEFGAIADGCIGRRSIEKWVACILEVGFFF